MKKAIYSFIYYRLLGWKTNVTVPNYDKYVPHHTQRTLIYLLENYFTVL